MISCDIFFGRLEKRLNCLRLQQRNYLLILAVFCESGLGLLCIFKFMRLLKFVEFRKSNVSLRRLFLNCLYYTASEKKKQYEGAEGGFGMDARFG